MKMWLDWRAKYEQAKADKKRKKELDNSKSGINIETEGESKSGRSDINRSRHLILIAMSEKGLNNIFKMVSSL